MYQTINQNGDNRFVVTCPHCQREFQVEPLPPGE